MILHGTLEIDLLDAVIGLSPSLFTAHGLDPAHLLVERKARSYGFRPELNDNADLKQRIETDTGLLDR